MSEIGPSYQLPEMRPFHQLQTRTRLVGGAVVTENGRLESDNYVAGVAGWSINGDGDCEFNDGTFRGAIAASSIDIGGSDASSFHVDADGNLWLGASTFASAPFKVSNTGSLTVTGGTITGGTITGSTIQTATSGKRVILDGSLNQIQIISSTGFSAVLSGVGSALVIDATLVTLTGSVDITTGLSVGTGGIDTDGSITAQGPVSCQVNGTFFGTIKSQTGELDGQVTTRKYLYIE